MKVGERVGVADRENDWTGQYSLYDIIGETTRSWLVLAPYANGEKQVVYNWTLAQAKKLPKSGEGKSYVIGTEADVILSRWVRDNDWKIVQQIDRYIDPKILLQIAKLIGYTKLPELPAEEIHDIQTRADVVA